MNKQMLEILNAKILEYMSREDNSAPQVIRIVYIAKLVSPHIKVEVQSYTKKQLYDYLNENFSVLDSFNGANRQLLVEVLMWVNHYLYYY